MDFKNLPLKKRTFFYKEEKLIYGEDLYIEFKNYKLPFSNQNIEEIKKQICAFLNSKGGRIFIGIDDNKIIKGIQLDYKKLDETRNNIINYTFGFFPKCRLNKINVCFIPIKNENNLYIQNLYVIKIIIHQGDTNQLYSIIDKGGFISFLRLPGQCANLTAQEIRDEIIRRNSCPDIPINENEFKDPEPENNEIYNINNIINKFNNMNFSNKKNNNSRKNRNINIYHNNYNDDDSDEEEYDDEEYEFDEDNELDEENEFNEFDEDDDEENEEEEEEELENNFHYNRGSKRYRGRGRKKNFRKNNNKYKNNYFVVKINTYGPNPNIQTLQLFFNNLPNCKKKYINKKGNIHGFLNFRYYEDAVKVIEDYTVHKPCLNGCGVRLTLQSIPTEI